MKDVTALVSARFTNLVAWRFPAVGCGATARQVEKYRSSGGRKGNAIVGRPVFLLDVVGRSSGEPQVIRTDRTHLADEQYRRNEATDLAERGDAPLCNVTWQEDL